MCLTVQGCLSFVTRSSRNTIIRYELLVDITAERYMADTESLGCSCFDRWLADRRMSA